MLLYPSPTISSVTLKMSVFTLEQSFEPAMSDWATVTYISYENHLAIPPTINRDATESSGTPPLCSSR